MDEVEKKIPEFLLKIIEGHSIFHKVYIKFWVTLATFSLIILVPTETKDGISLPFELGSYKKEDFYPLGFIIISILVICFGSTFSQSFRMSKLLHRAIEKVKNDYIYYDTIYLQDIVDGLIYPSLTRVAPLAQLSQGKYQFFPENKNIPYFRKVLATIYYTFLKVIAISVMHLLPAWALYISFSRGIYHKKELLLNLPIFVFWILGIASFMILAQLMFEDIRFTTRVWKRLLK